MPRSPNTPCVECGKLCWPSKKTGDRAYVPPAVHRCGDCRRVDPAYRVKGLRAKGIVHAWDCEKCGASCARPATKGQRPKWCDACKAPGRDHIPNEVRRSVYERDGWVCWLCTEPVDRSLVGSRSPWRPSLDHVTPRAAGGSDDSSNLKLAHTWCNSVRSDGRAYSPEDFRVAS